MQIKRSEIAAAVIIIGFIAAVIVLGVYPALQSAPFDQCTANVKNVGTAIGLYCGDYGGFMLRAENWTEVLAPKYMDSLDPLSCPSAKPTAEQLARYQVEGAAKLPIGYALHKPVAGINSALLADPAKTPTLFDSSEYAPNATADLTTLDFRHTGKVANVMFGDGHIATPTSAPTLPKPFLLKKPAPPHPEGASDQGHGEQ